MDGLKQKVHQHRTFIIDKLIFGKLPSSFPSFFATQSLGVKYISCTSKVGWQVVNLQKLD
ncbi:MAG: hypothetical protein COA78_23850 [Blastopirellula sp.]|nr:MAG: hypothetical protein COA78_23850 [Blastopirellula sp.]